MPAPVACTILPNKRIEKAGAIPHNSVPMEKINMAEKKSCRVEYRSIRKAVIGIVTPLISI